MGWSSGRSSIRGRNRCDPAPGCRSPGAAGGGPESVARRKVGTGSAPAAGPGCAGSGTPKSFLVACEERLNVESRLLLTSPKVQPETGLEDGVRISGRSFAQTVRKRDPGRGRQPSTSLSNIYIRQVDCTRDKSDKFFIPASCHEHRIFSNARRRSTRIEDRYGTADDQAEVSPDSKPSAKISASQIRR